MFIVKNDTQKRKGKEGRKEGLKAKGLSKGRTLSWQETPNSVEENKTRPAL